ncbi:MAG TPA: hypothetical protein VNZ62_16680 [Capillimicrobium sp.]|nr:hypothetical protein [Capillimicrobium sp.]
MDLLYRFEGTLGDVAPVGLAPHGLRIDIPFTGRLTEGVLGDGPAHGTEYLLQRRDGVGVIDARDTFAIPGGFLHARAHGFVRPPADVAPPPLEAMLDPAYEAPDLPLAIDGFALCETGVPAFEHLNRVLVKIDGWVNNGTGELVFEGRAAHATRRRRHPAGGSVPLAPADPAWTVAS